MKLFIGLMAGITISAGCGSETESRSVEQVVSGTIRDDGGEALPNATVTLRTGTFGELTLATTLQTDAQGKYSATVAGKRGQVLLISASAVGYVELHQRSAISGTGEISASLMLPFAEAMSCISGECSGTGVILSGLPDGVRGKARVFDPESESDAFPGDFDAIDGERLISGGFVWIGLEDENGDRVSALAKPARMDLEFQRPSWPAVIDITPGNGQIDVPFYAFDENLGTWKHESDAVLVAASGQKLTEADMVSLKSGVYSQRVFARGQAAHFSYWNIDWPVFDRSSTRVRFSPQASQAVLSGETFTGRASGIPGGGTQTGGNTGPSDPSVFCFNGPRSEAPSEDRDQDGIVGEFETGTLVVRANGKYYRLPKIRLPDIASDCGDPQGAILDIALTENDLLPIQLCIVNGVMTDLDGLPVVGSIVSAKLSALAYDLRADLCSSGCVESSSTDDAGRFSLTIPVAGSTQVRGFGQVTAPVGSTGAFRDGKTHFEGCPTTDVQLVADGGFDLYNLNIARTDDTIGWVPPVSASRVFVAKAQQYLKWAVIGPMETPTTYGVVPGAAIQDIPSDGKAPREALESSDLVRVFAAEPGDGFYGKSYEGLLQLP